MAEPRICPRCAYDLSGVIDAWDGACPTEGVCSECGHRFRWFEIFHPDHHDLRGFIEHAPRAEPRPGPLTRAATFYGRAWRTWFWTLLPSRFWSRIRVHHRFNTSAMAAWLLVLLLPVHVIAAMLSMGLMRLQGLQYFPGLVDALRYLSCWTYPFFIYDSGGALARPRLLFSTWPEYILPALAFHATMFLVLLLLARSRREARIRPAHLARAFVYGLSWIVLLAAFRAGRNAIVTAQEFINWRQGYTPPPQPTPGQFFILPAPRAAPVMPTYLETVSPELLTIVLFLWLAGWWYTAIRRGWELARAHIVWALLTITALLSALNVWVIMDAL